MKANARARYPRRGHEGTWAEFCCEVDESERRNHGSIYVRGRRA